MCQPQPPPTRLRAGILGGGSWLLLIIVAVSLGALMGWPSRHEILRGANDFSMLYAGGLLAASPELYDPQAFIETQEARVRPISHNMQFARLPHVAVLFWPFARLPYPPAYAVWQSVSLAALITSALLWYRMMGPEALALHALSIPAILSWLNGRDDSIVLLGLTLFIWLRQRERPFASGLAASLCLTLWHLLPCLVLVLGIRKEWRVLRGFALGLCGALLMATAAQGPSWPWRYASILRMDLLPAGTRPTLMQLSRGSWNGEVALSLLLLVAIVLAAWTLPATDSIAVSIAGGLALSRHATMGYCQFLLPAALLCLPKSSGPRKMALLVALTPPLFLFSIPLPWLLPIAPLLVVAAARWRGSWLTPGRLGTP